MSVLRTSCPPARPDQLVLDTRLPLLGVVLDPHAVAALFEQRWPEAGPVSAVTAGSSHGTSYQPGIRCVTTYPLYVETPSGPPFRTIGVVEAAPTGLTHRLYDEDSHLPSLRQAGDAEDMTPRLAGIFAAPPTCCAVVPVRYRPGSRCVLRYELTTAAGVRVLYGKVLAHDSERLADVLRRLLRADVPLVAPMLGCLPDMSMVLQRATGGSDLTSRVLSDATPGAARTALMRETGARLADLHATCGAPAPTRDLAGDVEELRTYLPVARHAWPGLAERLARAVDLVASHAEEGGEMVPSHGSFRTGQVVVEGNQPIMVDLDGFCWAEPARDVGNLLAYLAWRAIRRPEQAGSVTETRDAFLAGYRRARPSLDPHRCRVGEAAAMLKIAGRRFRSLAVDEWPDLPHLLAAAESLLAAEHRHAPPRPGWGLAGLDLALDTTVMTRLLRPLLGAASPVVTSAHLLGGKPGHRSVIEYHASGVSPGGPDRLIGKLYSDQRQAVRVHELMRHLRSDVFPPGGSFGVADPVGTLPRPAMAVYRPADGPFLDQVQDEAQACRAAWRAGRWLAALHHCGLVLDRRLDLPTEVANLRVWAGLVGERLPEAEPAARNLAERLAATADRLTMRTDVPIHKDFHYRHIVAGTPLVVIDLDEARMGDPAFDVAHFCANQRLLALRDHDGVPDAARLRSSFLEGYAHRLPKRTLRFFYAYTCLKIAKQLATGRGPQPGPEGDAWQHQIRTMLRRGLTCLAA